MVKKEKMINVCFLVFWICLVAVGKAHLSTWKNRDATTLFSIIREFGYQHVFLESWKGNDPCQDWYGVDCKKGEIISIDFNAMNLTGIISPRFADLTSLLLIDLSHNSLTGTIPVELTRLKLRNLDLSYNKLHGKVPQFRIIVPNTEGNPKIETNNTHVPSQTSNKKTAINLGFFIGIVVVSVLLVGGGCIALYLVMKMERFNRQSEPNEASEHTQQPSEHSEILEAENKAIPMHILRDATNDFCDSNIVGRGGFGAVYKGKMRDGIEVAVKRMDPSSRGKGIDQFRSEVSVLTRVHHRNVVVLHGYCLEGNEKLLVYQYMPQGTLSKHLFDWKDKGLRPLDWNKRLLVALDVARGVEYLHSLARQGQSYIHRDLKSSNILLGEDMRAKVSDFGLVRSTEEGRESIRTKFVGTFGYIAPEYASTGRVTKMCDVYSFGVILMELISGQRAIDETRSEIDTHIVVWFSKKFREKDFIDESIEVDEETRRSIEKVAELAIHCCAKEPEQRPDMDRVVTVFGSLIEPWKPIEIKDDDIDTTCLPESLPEMIKRWEHDIEASSSGT